jgi:hypothetical protein
VLAVPGRSRASIKEEVTDVLRYYELSLALKRICFGGDSELGLLSKDDHLQRSEMKLRHHVHVPHPSVYSETSI